MGMVCRQCNRLGTHSWRCADVVVCAWDDSWFFGGSISFSLGRSVWPYTNDDRSEYVNAVWNVHGINVRLHLPKPVQSVFTLLSLFRLHTCACTTCISPTSPTNSQAHAELQKCGKCENHNFSTQQPVCHSNSFFTLSIWTFHRAEMEQGCSRSISPFAQQFGACVAGNSIQLRFIASRVKHLILFFVFFVYNLISFSRVPMHITEFLYHSIEKWYFVCSHFLSNFFNTPNAYLATIQILIISM